MVAALRWRNRVGAHIPWRRIVSSEHNNGRLRTRFSATLFSGLCPPSTFWGTIDSARGTYSYSVGPEEGV